MRKIKASVDWSYFDRYADVIDQYMPSYGEGDSLTSQAVTAINHLIYKWYNDGDVYDNSHGMEGWANDLSSFANWLYTHTLVGSNISKIKDILDQIFICHTDNGYEAILKQLADEILSDDYILYMSANEPKQGSIYRCNGPFKFVEYYDDDEDEYYEPWEDEEPWEAEADDEY